MGVFIVGTISYNSDIQTQISTVDLVLNLPDILNNVFSSTNETFIEHVKYILSETDFLSATKTWN